MRASSRECARAITTIACMQSTAIKVCLAINRWLTWTVAHNNNNNNYNNFSYSHSLADPRQSTGWHDDGTDYQLWRTAVQAEEAHKGRDGAEVHAGSWCPEAEDIYTRYYPGHSPAVHRRWRYRRLRKNLHRRGRQTSSLPPPERRWLHLQKWIPRFTCVSNGE